MKQTKAQKIFCIVNGIFLGIVALICLLPMINIIALSFSSRNMVNAGAVTFWPKGFTLRSYQYMVESSGIFAAAWITIKRVFFGLLINLSMTILVAYPLSKEKQDFSSRTFYVGFFLFAMVFNGGLIPTFLVINQLGLIDTIWALILPNAVTMYYVLLMLNFFRGIPRGIEEAAIVDGAGWFTTLVRIYLPLSLPSLATITLFIIVGHWNEWFDGMIYNNKTYNYPLMTFLQFQIINFKTSDLRPEQLMADPSLAELNGRAIKSAAIVLCTVPILMFYPFLQKYFVTGIVMGSVKG